MIKEWGLKFIPDVELTSFGETALKQVKPNAIYFEDKSSDTQCYINIDGNTATIGFRGTEQKLKDWITDFKFSHQVVPYGNDSSKIRVHNGFLNAYKSVRMPIHKVIQNNIDKIKRIYVVGHSLGGALATLCAVDMQYNFNWINTSCITYGAPRVGNAAFVESFDKRIVASLRFFNKTDLVPCVPFEFIEFGSGGYKHVGLGVGLGKLNPFMGLQLLIKKLFKSDRISADLTNHSMELYTQNIKNY